MSTLDALLRAFAAMLAQLQQEQQRRTIEICSGLQQQFQGATEGLLYKERGRVEKNDAFQEMASRAFRSPSCTRGITTCVRSGTPNFLHT